MSVLGQQAQKIVTVFGGSGFIGRHLVRALAREGWRVRVAVRRPNSALFLKTAGDPGQVTLVQANIAKPDQIANAVAGADAVVNLVGILHETGKQKFSSVQAQGAIDLAQAAAQAKVSHFIQLSAIGADAQSDSLYARSKAEAETGVLAAFKKAVILRPSLVIGPEDGFQSLCKMATLAPALPLFGGGLVRINRFMCLMWSLRFWQGCPIQKCRAKHMNLAARSNIASKLMELMLAHTQQNRILLPLPFFVAQIMSQFTRFYPIRR